MDHLDRLIRQKLAVHPSDQPSAFTEKRWNFSSHTALLESMGSGPDSGAVQLDSKGWIQLISAHQLKKIARYAAVGLEAEYLVVNVNAHRIPNLRGAKDIQAG